MALAVYEYKFTLAADAAASCTFSSNTRVPDEEHRLGGNGLTLGFWLHAANDTALETAIEAIADLSTDFSRLVRRAYPGMKGMTCISLDGEQNIGTLTKRGAAGSWANVIMSPPRVGQHYPAQSDSSVGCQGVVTFLQLAKG